MRIRSWPKEKRPSARLQPPGLQVQTKGPGFLASPILTTVCQGGRASQATQLVVAWAHGYKTIQADWGSQVLLTHPVATTTTSSEWDPAVTLPSTNAAGDCASSKAVLVVAQIEIPPTTPLPFHKGDGFSPGSSCIVAGRL
eukprot:4271725-Amphidinium_carterae.1